MNWVIKFLCCVSLFQLAFAGTLQLTKQIPIPNSWGADYITTVNDTTFLVIYEDSSHSTHLTFFDIDSNEFTNDIEFDFQATCAVDPTNSFFCLRGNLLYMTCIGSYNNISIIEYNIDIFNITRVNTPSNEFITDLEYLVMTEDGKYLFTALDSVTYFVQIEIETFSVIKTVNLPTTYGPYPFAAGMAASSNYLYVSTETGQIISYDINTMQMHNQVSDLKGENQAFIVSSNDIIYNFYLHDIVVYDSTFKILQTIPVPPNDSIYPFGALLTDQYAYWTFANGIISLQTQTYQVSFLSMTNPKYSVGPTYMAASASNPNSLVVAVSLSANDFGNGLLYTLQQE